MQLHFLILRIIPLSSHQFSYEHFKISPICPSYSQSQISYISWIQNKQTKNVYVSLFQDSLGHRRQEQHGNSNLPAANAGSGLRRRVGPPRLGLRHVLVGRRVFGFRLEGHENGLVAHRQRFVRGSR